LCFKSLQNVSLSFFFFMRSKGQQQLGVVWSGLDAGPFDV
jgi:hypothetical protein